ncbi:hypothetical protein COCON_G00195990 [Conger conger]|uniref:TIR domain-containing protein n=1 Tax=Conger conger TaxID=82655 RepID=A0A9Q1D191_CONCO|nr:toll-like receptor 8 [Conger conger]KAJ8255735.1 hypothetical protein COCON_G00195990 [Conger conger]
MELCWLNWLILCLLLRHAGCGMNYGYPCHVKMNSTANTVKFDCSSLRLKEVPTWITQNITEIHLSENHIKHISTNAFNGLQNLTYLDLRWANQNQAVYIEKGVFAQLTNLAKLNLCGNILPNVPESLPSGLKMLNLSKNKIISISPEIFTKLQKITELVLSKNCYYWNPCGKEYDPGNGSFSSLTELNILDLAFNNLSSVPKELPPSLQHLDLASNRIRQVTAEDFIWLTNLTILELQGNCPRCYNSPYPCDPCQYITIHDLAFQNLTKLETLNLAGNSLKFMKSSWFLSLVNLKTLFLSFNFLRTAIADGGFLGYLKKLELLDLSYNYDLKEYPSTLDLSPSFSKLVSLRSIHLQGYVFKEICGNTLNPLSGLKNLSVLDLGTNFIVHTNASVFKKFGNIKLIYLSENRLYPVTEGSHENQSGERCGGNGKGNRLNPDPHVPLLTAYSQNVKPDTRYEPQSALVKAKCFASGRVLDLSSNNIFFISPIQFEDFGNISCLNLSNNGFAAALNGTEFQFLSDLKYLDLSFNKIDLAYDNAFSELKKLEVLDLSHNAHYFMVSGVTHNLNFLQNLPSLKVLNLSRNYISTLTSKNMTSNSLTELQFQKNYLGRLWKENDHSYVQLFKNLVNLEYLDISSNEIDRIPQSVFQNLPRSIIKLCLAHNSMTNFKWSNLKLFPSLQFLDLSHNYISEVSTTLSNLSETLKFLHLGKNKIAQLSDGFLRGAENIQFLDLRSNYLRYINKTAYETGRRNHSQMLFLGGNPFSCTCERLDFIMWLKMRTDVIIPDLATSINCAVPTLRKGDRMNVVDFKIKNCVDNNIAFLIHFLSAFLIICIMVSATTMHLFYWDASYALHYWRAKMQGYYRLRSGGNVYDAFVTYDTKNPHVSEWVHNHLRVELEEVGDKLSPICLEDRDWTPGIPVLDNLTQSIGQSRKTVFVLTEDYVRNGTFRMAMYLAHQRLLDDNDDVMVLVLLEPVLQHSRLLRLRRRLCSRSVLQWPRSPSAERWFWQCLRNVIRVDNQAMYNKQYSQYFTSK